MRQKIFGHVFDDYVFHIRKPNDETKDISVVCKTFAGDIKEVSKVWRGKELAERAEQRMANATTTKYIQDMMGSLEMSKRFLAGRDAATTPNETAAKDARKSARQSRKNFLSQTQRKKAKIARNAWKRGELGTRTKKLYGGGTLTRWDD